MKEYVKPVVMVDENLSEGVYTASGSECYTVSANIHQTPQMGRGDYRIQVNAIHAAGDGHHSGEQVLTLVFNQPVTYNGSNGTLKSGDGTNTIEISYNYHNNENENIGLGDVIVQADAGLSVTDAKLLCNYKCGQH